MSCRIFGALAAVCFLAAAAASAPLLSSVSVALDTTRLQSPSEALDQDAAEYARLRGLPPEEALRRLRAQEDSVAITDRLREEFGDRLAGISIEHDPVYRIVVLLTDTQPVPDRVVSAGGTSLPIRFETGAAATHDQLLAAVRAHQADIREGIPKNRGIGIDARTGRLVVLVRRDVTERADLSAADALLSALTGVPSHVRLVEGEARNLAIEGGARVVGTDPADGRRYTCTTGFVVADATRTAVLTAAHCPDELAYVGTDGNSVPLSYVGAWGAIFQDVQIHASEAELKPQFLVDRVGGVARPLTGQRTRASTRQGDIVCRRGESSGYSCSTVDFVDFAPPGDLCAGPCEPVWVSVDGPSCRGGDSGGPVFLGTTAFGITKGASYARGGACSFYFYMSTDYLPDGWSLLFQRPEPAPADPDPGVAAAGAGGGPGY